MSEPRRLLEIGNDEDLALLRSAKDDAPNRGAQMRTLAALGVASSVMAASASTAAATTTGFSLVKWIGIGLAGTALIGGGAVVADRMMTDGAPAPQAQLEAPAVVDAPAPPPVERHAAPPVEEPAEEDDEDEQVEDAEVAEVADAEEAPAEPVVAPKAPAKSPAAVAPKAKAQARKPAAKKSSLAAEVAALDDARSAMEGGNAKKALAALDQHDRKFDKGMLGPEATVLRIEVLIQAGKHAEAAALAQSFLAANPSSPYAARVRTLLAQATLAR